MGTIRQEILQTRPFDSAADEAVVTLLATADRVHGRLAAVLERRDITLQQYNVLRILRGAGERGLPTLDVAARMFQKSPGITRLLERLEARRLARRVRCPNDRRQVLCYATPRALELLEAIEAPLTEAGLQCLAPLDAAETALLVAMLDEIRAAARKATPARAESARDERTKETRE
jgi:DNA-binding MarR family transcriptional regulator